jgi:hypothetical protein
MSRIQTNTEVITNLMEFSRMGPLMQGFIIEALRIYADAVINRQDELPKNGLISAAAWVACAQEVIKAFEEQQAANNAKSVN